MPRLVVQLVTWNGAKYISYLFDSLRKQLFHDFHLAILDNASSDDTVALIKKEITHVPFSYSLHQEKKNIGFTGGHNKLFQQYKEGEYVLLLNQDMYLMPNCLEQSINFLEMNKKIATVSPRLMRWEFDRLHTTDSGLQSSFTDDVDALGLKVFRNRRVIEQYTCESWKGIKKNFHSNVLSVFGASGAFPLFRRSILDTVSFSDGTFFDTLYYAYKEDVDLAFRLQSAGFDSAVLLDVVAYHDRSGAGPKELKDSAAAKNKKNQSSWVIYNSYKNHLMTLYKNEYWQNILLDFFPIFWYEIKKFCWFLFFNPKVLKGVGDIISERSMLKQHKKEIIFKRKRTWSEIRRWWVR